MKTNPQPRHYARQNIKVAVDNCIFTVISRALHVLLIRMKKEPFQGMWALPGGLIGNDESPEDAAVRILMEETGVRDVYLEQLYTFGAPARDPLGRVVSLAYFALIPAGDVELRTSSKYSAVGWWGAEALPPLAYDHNEIVEYALKRLRWKLDYTNVAWSLLPDEFSFGELQSVYEAVLGQRLDRRNFRKKILSYNLLTPSKERVVRGAHRPPTLYRFKTREPMILKG
jgi:8-oxo-dGTP diphosphatase